MGRAFYCRSYNHLAANKLLPTAIIAALTSHHHARLADMYGMPIINAFDSDHHDSNTLATIPDDQNELAAYSSLKSSCSDLRLGMKIISPLSLAG